MKDACRSRGGRFFVLTSPAPLSRCLPRTVLYEARITSGETMPTLLRAPTREYRTISVDSHFWDGFRPRADDIVIATYAKCGTT